MVGSAEQQPRVREGGADLVQPTPQPEPGEAEDGDEERRALRRWRYDGQPALRRGGGVEGAACGLAGVCFLVVLAGIALGLTIIIAAGRVTVVSIDHVYPTIVDEPK